MSESPLNLISKIGNYALPSFSAFLTASLALGNPSWDGARARYFIVSFAIYTLLSAFVAYWHRIAWLRFRKKHGENTNLPSLHVASFFILHAVLIAVLIFVTYKFVWI